MEASSQEDLRKELARLEEDEARVSAQRRHLHRQIDFGFASDEAQAREREISNERRELHRRIDELRELLGLPSGPGTARPSDAGTQGLSTLLGGSLVDAAAGGLEDQHLL